VIGIPYHHNVYTLLYSDCEYIFQLNCNRKLLNYVSCVFVIVGVIWHVLAHAGCVFDIAGFGEIGKWRMLITVITDKYRTCWIAFYVTAPPRMSGDYQRVHVAAVGTTLRLTCPLVARSTALVDWWKAGHRIHDGWVRHRPVNATLRIRDVQFSDSGRYTCEATNGFGSARAMSLLYIYGLCHRRLF